METNKIEKVTKHQMNGVLRDIHKAVAAMRQLCREHTGGSLYDVVAERVEAEFDAVETKLVERWNGLIDRYNEARARLAGDMVNPNAVNGQASFTTGEGFPVEIREFAIARIGLSNAWCIRLNGDEIDDTALLEDDAKRIFNAVSKWRDKKNAEREAEAKMESEAAR